jgi:hypothetical protein
MDGAALHAGRNRRRGAVLALCGLVVLLIALIYGAAAFIVPSHPDILPDWIAYAPEPDRAPTDLVSPAAAILGFLLAFGLVALALGLGMLIRGTSNPRLTRWLVALCLIFFAAAMLTLYLGVETVPRIYL